MSNILINPFPQFFNSTPTGYVSGVLRFYVTQTSTPLAVYSDAALSASLGTSVTLNAAARAASLIYLGNADYKITLEDSLGNIIWTADPVHSSDFSTTAQVLTYAGNPNGNVAGTAGTGSIPSSVIWDRTNNIWYVCTTTGSAAAAVWTAINSSSTTASVPAPQGRLTLTSVTPVLAADVTAATTVYYTPYIGNLVPIYNSTSTLPYSFSELSLALVSAHTASAIFDVFVFSNSGVLTLATGPAWTTATAGAGARGTGAGTTQLSRLNGFLVNTVSMTARNGSTTYTVGANLGTYVGSISMDGTNGQVSCLIGYGQSRKWGVWNAYNRQPIILKAGDGTATWTYTTATYRASNAASANSISVFCGLAEEVFDLSFAQEVVNSGNNIVNVGIGWNSTSSPSGQTPAQLANSVATITQARFIQIPSIGINVVTSLEKSTASGTTTWTGTEASMLLTAIWRG